MTRLRVVEINGHPSEGRAFHRVPARVYGTRWPQWTPTIASEARRLFDPDRNPSLAGTAFARWVAVVDNEPVGRVAAFAPESPGDIGYFGCFECVDDPKVAQALLRAAEAWLAGRSRRLSIGPLLVNPRDQIGLLTDGFDRPAGLLTPYNPPYYQHLVEGAGYRVAVRLRAYGWEPAIAAQHAMEELDGRLSARGGIVIRSIDVSRLEEEALVIANLINRSFGATWRWIAITRAEALQLARDLRPILVPSLCLVAEDRLGPCGVALTLPDANWLIRRIGGRLWPFGWLRALLHRRRIPWARFMALAVLPGKRAAGTAVRLMVATHRALLAGGFQYAELSQVFDDNAMMRRVLEHMGCPVVKRYAVYERGLTDGTGEGRC